MTTPVFIVAEECAESAAEYMTGLIVNPKRGGTWRIIRRGAYFWKHGGQARLRGGVMFWYAYKPTRFEKFIGWCMKWPFRLLYRLTPLWHMAGGRRERWWYWVAGNLNFWEERAMGII